MTSLIAGLWTAQPPESHLQALQVATYDQQALGGSGPYIIYVKVNKQKIANLYSSLNSLNYIKEIHKRFCKGGDYLLCTEGHQWLW